MNLSILLRIPPTMGLSKLSPKIVISLQIKQKACLLFPTINKHLVLMNNATGVADKVRRARRYGFDVFVNRVDFFKATQKN